MSDPERPDPDELLASIRAGEERSRRGKLKIYLGMCPGVGKTYAMLQAGHARQAAGVKVLVGVVEHHGRVETLALLENLPLQPRQRLSYRDVQMEEMDLDGILAAHPNIVLVDELAHTNVPGSRHPKRCQDVLELLDAGINVYSTLNVQHIESRVDLVRQITGAPVHETVPDSILDQADEIELVDLTPEQLLKRLADGKVYLGDRAAAATQNFFKEGNLVALREMALRYTAETVDRKLRGLQHATQIGGPARAGERLLVAVGPSPSSATLIRWTRRVAAASNASWIAVYVDPTQALGETAKNSVQKNLALARELGAEVILTTGENIPETLLRTARQHKVTQIVVGKPARHSVLDFLRGGSLVDQLIRTSGDIDIYIVRNENKAGSIPIKVEPQPIPWAEYAWTFGTIGVLTVIGWFIVGVAGYDTVSLIYLLAVVLLALRFRRGPVVAAACLSALCWDIFFIPPIFTFSVSQLEDGLMLAMFIVVAVIMGSVTSRLREREAAERRRENKTTAVNQLLKSLASATSIDVALAAAAKQIDALFSVQTSFLLPNDDNTFTTYPNPFGLSENEEAVASWAYQNGKPAGRFTNTLGQAEQTFVPLQTAGHTIGVMALRPLQAQSLELDEMEMLLTFSTQIAVSIEQENLATLAHQSKILAESERLRKTLLDSVSHELKTPLAAISSAAEMAMQPGISPISRDAALSEIGLGAQRLTRVVNNLLDMTRIESGLLQPHKEWGELRELLDSALEHLETRLAQHKVQIELAPDTPMVRLDFPLIEQCLANLLTNAALYTPAHTRIILSAVVRPTASGNELILRVEDDGPGLDMADPDHVFRKFYRGAGVPSGGLGLGMSIVRGLVEAHGGKITVQSAPTTGTRFRIALPVEIQSHLQD
ncbi:MAG: sensor histidine kinase KdpD [Chthoniobacterales bacterium]